MIQEQSQHPQSKQQLLQLHPKQQQQSQPFQPYNSMDTNLASRWQQPSLPSSPLASKNISVTNNNNINNLTILTSQSPQPIQQPSFPSSNHWVPIYELNNPKHNTNITNSSKIPQYPKKYGSNIAESLTRQQNIRVIQDIHVKQLRLAFDCSNKMYIMDARTPIQLAANSDESLKEQHDLLGMSRRKHTQSIISKEGWNYDKYDNNNEDNNYQQQQFASTQSSSMKQSQSPGLNASKKLSNLSSNSSADGIQNYKSTFIQPQKFKSNKVCSGKASILHYLGNINDSKTNEYLKASSQQQSQQFQTSSQWSSSLSQSTAANIPLVQMRRTLFKYTNNRKIPGLSLPQDDGKIQFARGQQQQQQQRNNGQLQQQQQQQYHLMQSSYTGSKSKNIQGHSQSQPVVNKSNSSQSQYSSLINSLIDNHDSNIPGKSQNQMNYKKYLQHSNNSNSQSQLPLIPFKTTPYQSNSSQSSNTASVPSTQRQSFVEDTLKAYSVKHFCDDFNKIPLALRKQYYLSQDASQSNQIFFLGGANEKQQQQQQNGLRNINKQNRTAYLTTNGKYGFFTMKQNSNGNGSSIVGGDDDNNNKDFKSNQQGIQINEQGRKVIQINSQQGQQQLQQQQQYQSSSQSGLIIIENQQQLLSQRQPQRLFEQSEQLLLQSSYSSLDKGQHSGRKQKDIASGAYDLAGIQSQKNPPSHVNLEELLGPQDDMQRYKYSSRQNGGDVKIKEGQESKDDHDESMKKGSQDKDREQQQDNEQQMNQQVEKQLQGEKSTQIDQDNLKNLQKDGDLEKNMIKDDNHGQISNDVDDRINNKQTTGSQTKQMQIQLKQLQFEQRNIVKQNSKIDSNDNSIQVFNSNIKTARESQSIEKQQFLLNQQRLMSRKHSEGIFNASSSYKTKSIPDISGWIAGSTSLQQEQQPLRNKKSSKINEQLLAGENHNQIELGQVNRSNTMGLIVLSNGNINVNNSGLLKQQHSGKVQEKDQGDSNNNNINNINNDDDQDLKEYLSLMNKSKEEQQIS